ncbi:hypothetical protein RIF29_28720 [Crotalaria pallida]|uniref:Uncharacterized protein n=1 Tax=Crotalaria pallida TaxID=3830 RepID=A0AAN9EDN4_CROPI
MVNSPPFDETSLPSNGAEAPRSTLQLTSDFNISPSSLFSLSLSLSETLLKLCSSTSIYSAQSGATFSSSHSPIPKCLNFSIGVSWYLKNWDQNSIFYGMWCKVLQGSCCTLIQRIRSD